MATTPTPGLNTTQKCCPLDSDISLFAYAIGHATYVTTFPALKFCVLKKFRKIISKGEVTDRDEQLATLLSELPRILLFVR
jgi:hypothetical protein